MIKCKPRMYYEHDKGIVHCEAAHGSDYTLCGFTLDGDQGEISEVIGKKISCGDCISIIQFCRDIRLDAVYRKRSASRAHTTR